MGSLNLKEMDVDTLEKYCVLLLKSVTEGHPTMASPFFSAIKATAASKDLKGMRTLAREFEKWAKDLPPAQFFVLQERIRQEFGEEEKLSSKPTVAERSNRTSTIADFRFEITGLVANPQATPIATILEGDVELYLDSAQVLQAKGVDLTHFALSLRKWLEASQGVVGFNYVDDRSGQVLATNQKKDGNVIVKSDYQTKNNISINSVMWKNAIQTFLTQFSDRLEQELGVSLDDVAEQADES
jgi:hypothetical protein